MDLLLEFWNEWGPDEPRFPYSQQYAVLALCVMSSIIEAIGPLRKAPSESEYSSDVLDKALFCADLIKDADQYFRKEMLARYETSRMVSSQRFHSEVEKKVRELRRQEALKAASARAAPFAAKKEKIRAIWASGKYDNRDRCAEEEFRALGVSYSFARKALRNTPDPAT